MKEECIRAKKQKTRIMPKLTILKEILRCHMNPYKSIQMICTFLFFMQYSALCKNERDVCAFFKNSSTQISQKCIFLSVCVSLCVCVFVVVVVVVIVGSGLQLYLANVET